MDSPELRELSSRKISVAILIWVVLIFSMFFVNQCSKNNQLKREISKMRKEMKTDYEERIKKREVIIQSLRKDNELKRKEIERVFNEVFNPELLYGFDAILYDEALVKSNHFGTNWYDEMKKDEVYNNFILHYLENEGITPEEFEN